MAREEEKQAIHKYFKPKDTNKQKKARKTSKKSRKINQKK